MRAMPAIGFRSFDVGECWRVIAPGSRNTATSSIMASEFVDTLSNFGFRRIRRRRWQYRWLKKAANFERISNAGANDASVCGPLNYRFDARWRPRCIALRGALCCPVMVPPHGTTTRCQRFAKSATLGATVSRLDWIDGRAIRQWRSTHARTR